MPSRFETRGTGKPQRKRSGSGTGPWGVVIREAACGCLFASNVLVPAEPSVAVQLVRAAAVAMWDGPSAGMISVDVTDHRSISVYSYGLA